jgi:hypothetical protein
MVRPDEGVSVGEWKIERGRSERPLQGNIACLLHGLTASIATPVSHPDLALLLVYGLTASITTPVSQYDGALFH